MSNREVRQRLQKKYYLYEVYNYVQFLLRQVCPWWNAIYFKGHKMINKKKNIYRFSGA